MRGRLESVHKCLINCTVRCKYRERACHKGEEEEVRCVCVCVWGEEGGGGHAWKDAERWWTRPTVALLSSTCRAHGRPRWLPLKQAPHKECDRRRAQPPRMRPHSILPLHCHHQCHLPSPLHGSGLLYQELPGKP